MTQAGNMFLIVCTLALVLGQAYSQSTYTCELMVNPVLDAPDREDISGNIVFTQQAFGEDVTVKVNIAGFDTSDNDTEHGFHVHEGDDIVTDGCNSAGGHFNPGAMNHGAPADAVRHVGDLGNIVEDGSGNVSITIVDSELDFDGTNNILGRTIVVHARRDDLGLGGNPESLKTGNAGQRLGCCLITATSSGRSSIRASTSLPVLLGLVMVKFLKNVIF